MFKSIFLDAFECHKEDLKLDPGLKDPEQLLNDEIAIFAFIAGVGVLLGVAVATELLEGHNYIMRLSEQAMVLKGV